ncbi:PAS domain S-box-containing protein/diguanylate cyclase (GGDEF) domain-containing protein [Roseateles sp. YR242]|uniref:diguanylate cyclase domain-containing protein n=1 Tax=Roseateles sp. YR242 TaxID=1855305 RepID=UPI0008B755ED|nr:diguanylate cyclase [Roseateles sp. YR242]SEL84085.1 PAS domain S-box-containing protein/diguanylate cyclase (GGDEF) domain-containing protein [Roseateles sp. YR242]
MRSSPDITLRTMMGRGVGLLLLSLAAIAVLSGLLAWRAQTTVSLLQRADRINRSLPQLHRVTQDLLNAETGQRGYLLTQKGSYLQPYRDAMLGLEQRLNELVQRNPDPLREPRLQRIRELALLKLQELGQTLRLHDSGRHEEALELVMSDQGQRHMDEFRDLIGEVLADMQAERGAINARLQKETGQAELLLLVGLGALTVFTVLAVTQVISRTRDAERSEHRLRGIADNVPAMIGQFDRHGRLLFANVEAGRVFGFDPQAVVGQDMQELHTPQDAALLLPYVERVLGGERVEFDIEFLVAGELRHFHQCFVPDHPISHGAKDRAGAVDGFYAVSMDITDRKRHADEVARSEKRMKAVTDNLPVLISYVDADQRVRYVNETIRTWLGQDPAHIVGSTVEQLMGPELYAQRRPHLMRALQGERVEFEVASTLLGRLHHLRNIYLPDVGPGGHVVGVYTLSIDITPMKQAEAQLAQLASSDALTGLPNRRELDRGLERALARQRRRARDGGAMALVFLDVDGFKSINDTYGHSVGDEVLCAFADCLRRSVRASDLVARLAGDEFIAVLEGLNHPDEAAQVATKILEAVRSEAMAGLTVTTSIGVATVIDAEVPARELVALADRALYEAKRAGRNRFAVQHWPGSDRRH